MKAYSEFTLDNGLLFDYSGNDFPTKLHAWTDKISLRSTNSTYFGFVFKESTQLHTSVNTYSLLAGQYFCQHTEIALEGGSGIVIERLSFKGMNMIGGPLENRGRLKYIDGCTDSLLVPPVKLGDPCLNALFFPPNIDQTSHTHPSMRVGMVIKGAGRCVTPERTYDLLPGMVFIIHEEGEHKFQTLENQALVVIAYHPDSDVGPQDEDHPMINRTIVEGVSAAKIEEIRTK